MNQRKRIYNRIFRIFERVDIRIVVLIWIIATAVFVVFLHYFHLKGVIEPDYDTFWFDNVLYNTVSGRNPFFASPNHYAIPKEYPSHHHFSHHNQPILLLIIPVYYLLPSVYTISILQVIWLAVAAVPLFQLTNKRLSKRNATMVVMAYLLNPIVFWNAKSFHPITLAPLLVFTLIFSYQFKRNILFAISFLLLLSLKETTPILLMPLGIYYLYTGYQNGFGSITRMIHSFLMVIGSGIWFVVSFKYVIPYFTSSGYVFTGRYSYLGDSIGDILITLILRPEIWLPHLFTTQSILYIIAILATVSFLPIVSLSILVAVPYLLINILSTNMHQINLNYQYQMMIIPVLYYSSIKSIAVIKSKQYKVDIDSIVVLLLLSSGISFAVFSGWYLWTQLLV